MGAFVVVEGGEWRSSSRLERHKETELSGDFFFVVSVRRWRSGSSDSLVANVACARRNSTGHVLTHGHDASGVKPIKQKS